MPKGLDLYFKLHLTVGPPSLTAFPHIQDTYATVGTTEITDEEIMYHIDEYISHMTKKKQQLLYAIKRHIKY